MIRRVGLALLAGAVLLGGAAGCAKRTIDPDKTNSVEVPGTDGSLMKFCDGSILIYWTPGNTSDVEDDYEFIVYDGCTPDGKMINGRDINPGTSSQEPTADLDAGEDDE